ncbi:MAG TPA: ROK family transcriptional regulator [Gaiellaceae bacterium]|nr:ROK family transcriptional regulator [Gaiellaceae bacterium]
MKTISRSGSPQLMRRLNSALVLRAIREAGSASRSELVRATGLSKPTVSEVVEGLLRTGYVSEAADGDGRGRPGPRARLLTFRADLGHVLGIDVGADKVLVHLADLSGTILATERHQTRTARDAGALLKALRAAVAAALRRGGVPRASLKAVTVGTPGIVDPASGRITLAPQLPGWEGIDLGSALGRSFDCPVLVENEVRLSVLAERWRGAAQEIDDAVYVQVGVGIGAGILIGGQLYRGADGAAGEIGYLPYPGGRPLGDGPGPFEDAAGGNAFARRGREAASGRGGRLLRQLTGGDAEAVDAKVVFAAARQGDAAARAIVDELTRTLAHGIAAVVVVLNPSTVIVGGGLSRAGADLLEPLDRYVSELVPLPPRLVLSSFGDESVALGAVRLALQSVDERLFSFAESASA